MIVHSEQHPACEASRTFAHTFDHRINLNKDLEFINFYKSHKLFQNIYPGY